MQFRFRSAIAGVLASAVVGSTLLIGGPALADAASCSTAPSSGGDWRSYGHDLSNTRSQPDEHVIDAAKAATLAKSWSFSAASAGGKGEFQSTPVVADGCLYAATTGGFVYALNADTGALVWSHKFDIDKSGYAGSIVGAVAVSNGRVIVHVNRNTDPWVASLDQNTGSVIWETPVGGLTDQFINASVVVFDGIVFTGISGGEAAPDARGAFALLDESDGTLLKQTYTIDDADFAAGYGGASVWSTPAIDPATKYAYVGGGNPASKRFEHKNSNAILKIDMDRNRSTFGEIVDTYKGDVDQYFPGLSSQPACQYLGEHPNLQILGVWSAACLQLDLDFGASPNLFRDASGRLVVGALQKSGVYHAVLASNMDKDWTALVGTPCFACNAASAAYDGKSILGVSVAPGQMYSLDKNYGLTNWMSPIGDGIHFQSTSVAKGVAYTTDTKGFLNAIDTATGLPVFTRRLASDTGSGSVSLSASGVAIARNSVYAAYTSSIVSYK